MWPWRKQSGVQASLTRLEARTEILLRQGGRLMAQIDDLKAALQAASDRLDSMQVKLDDVQGDIQELIDAVPPDLTEVVAMAEALKVKVEGLGADLDATPDPDAEAEPEG